MYCYLFAILLVGGLLWWRAPALASDFISIDTDNDGLSDFDEANVYHTDPNNPDTDGDNHSDGTEVKFGYSPLFGSDTKMSVADTDNDGLTDDKEIVLKTDLSNSDTDGDGYLDGAEVFTGFNPLQGGRDRSARRRVEVNLSGQTMAYYFNDVKLDTMLVSTGRAGYHTPTGNFSVLRKVPVKTYYTVTGLSYPNTKWNLEFKKSLYIHNAYWHNDFGVKPRSGGCINLNLADSARMYKFMDVGDKVKVIGITPKKSLKLPVAADSKNAA